MSNPKFLNVEKRVPYNVRLPKRLIDKLNSYAELTGNTTTNIVNNVLDDFLSGRIVVNDYLDNIGGVSVKIPYAIHQKINFIKNSWNLKEYNSSERLHYPEHETYFAELFEIKKIPNNLDIYNGDSYVANKKQLLFKPNAFHSGIELFIYNIAETIFADSKLYDKFDSFVNCLYCLYFEVDEYDDVDIYLIDYLSAINLLSASGNDDYKDLIIAVATELQSVDDVVKNYKDKFYDSVDLVIENSGDDSEVDRIEKELHEKCLSIVNSEISAIADKYNSNNIILFGSDIFSKLAIKEIDSAVNENVDDFIDKIVAEKVDKIFNEKFDEMEKLTAKMNKKLDNINDSMIELKVNKTN